MFDLVRVQPRSYDIKSLVYDDRSQTPDAMCRPGVDWQCEARTLAEKCLTNVLVVTQVADGHTEGFLHLIVVDGHLTGVNFTRTGQDGVHNLAASLRR